MSLVSDFLHHCSRTYCQRLLRPSYPTRLFIQETDTAFHIMPHQKTRPHFSTSVFDCSICLESRAGSDGVLLDCNHSFCKACFKTYLETGLKGDIMSIQCPNCPIFDFKKIGGISKEEMIRTLFRTNLSLESMGQVLTPAEVTKYEVLLKKLRCETLLQYFPSCVSHCPKCNDWSLRSDNERARVVCKKCQHKYCFRCRRGWHIGSGDCTSSMKPDPADVKHFNMRPHTIAQPTISNLELKYGSDQVKRFFRESQMAREDAELLSTGTYKRCPKCTILVTKISGCHHVTCYRCRTNFCYGCASIQCICGNGSWY